MIRAAIYARFSSEKQNERSIEDQIELCRTLANRQGYTVVGTYEDRAVSGASTANRLGFLKMMRAAKNGEFDVIVTEDVDRISRDQADFHLALKQLRFLNIDLCTVTGIVGQLEGSVRAMMGQLYLENLAQKTRRGLAGVVRDGRHAGGRSYGYRAIPGQPGRLVVEDTEAQIVRRIFADYLKGDSARQIAVALNRERIPGPRTGGWNASTISGSRKRMNGILQNQLYAGRIVWNRQSFIKNPDTGKRVSRPNPEGEWMTRDAEELRIVDDETFAAVQRIKTQRANNWRYVRRPRHLLSGLLKCGCCGSGYVVMSKDKRGLVIGCSRAKETGLCNNRRTLSLNAIETRVIEGVEKHLAAPDLISEYIREYHRTLQAMRDGEGKRRTGLQRKLVEVERELEKVLDLLVKGLPTRALKNRLTKLEGQREQIEAEIEEIPPSIVTLHPNLAELYRRKVADLKATLASLNPERRNEAYVALRELVEKIVIHPTGQYRPVDIEIHGRLAVSCGVPRRRTFPCPRSLWEEWLRG